MDTLETLTITPRSTDHQPNSLESEPTPAMLQVSLFLSKAKLAPKFEKVLLCKARFGSRSMNCVSDKK